MSFDRPGKNVDIGTKIDVLGKLASGKPVVIENKFGYDRVYSIVPKRRFSGLKSKHSVKNKHLIQCAMGMIMLYLTRGAPGPQAASPGAASAGPADEIVEGTAKFCDGFVCIVNKRDLKAGLVCPVGRDELDDALTLMRNHA